MANYIPSPQAPRFNNDLRIAATNQISQGLNQGVNAFNQYQQNQVNKQKQTEALLLKQANDAKQGLVSGFQNQLTQAGLGEVGDIRSSINDSTLPEQMKTSLLQQANAKHGANVSAQRAGETQAYADNLNQFDKASALLAEKVIDPDELATQSVQLANQLGIKATDSADVLKAAKERNDVMYGTTDEQKAVLDEQLKLNDSNRTSVMGGVDRQIDQYARDNNLSTKAVALKMDTETSLDSVEKNWADKVGSQNDVQEVKNAFKDEFGEYPNGAELDYVMNMAVSPNWLGSGEMDADAFNFLNYGKNYTKAITQYRTETGNTDQRKILQTLAEKRKTLDAGFIKKGTDAVNKLKKQGRTNRANRAKGNLVNAISAKDIGMSTQEFTDIINNGKKPKTAKIAPKTAVSARKAARNQLNSYVTSY